MPWQQRRSLRTAVLVLGIVLLLGLWWWAGREPAGVVTPRDTSVSTAQSGATTARATTRHTGSMPSVSAADLPAEARHTLALIEAGGPFPYERDGAVFQNRERLLPREPSGYYHEYTVTTPGEDDRGARRIITGRQGERYWTEDHYGSFARIREDP